MKEREFPCIMVDNYTKLTQYWVKMSQISLYSTMGLLPSMNKFMILAIFAILGAGILAATGTTILTSVLAQTLDNATMAGNMTGGNMTDMNATGSISKNK